jgi:hypothetical protein
MLRIRKITDIKEFEQLEKTWNILLEKCSDRHVQLKYDWYKIWLDVFGRDMKLFVLVVEDGNEVIGIAPLIIRKQGSFYGNSLKFNQVIFIGTGFTDRSDFIILRDNEVVGKVIFEYIFSHSKDWDEIELHQLNTDSSNFIFLKNLHSQTLHMK